MAITQSNGGKTASATTSFTASLSTAPASTSRVVVLCAGNTTVTTPTGWTLRTSQVNFMGHYLFDRAGDGTTSSWNFTQASGLTVWFIAEIPGGAYVNALSANDPLTGTTYATPSLTPSAGDRELLVSVGATTNSSTVRTATWGAPWTELFDDCVAVSDYPMHTVARQEVTANGSTAYTGTATFTTSSTGRTGITAAYSFSSSPAVDAGADASAVVNAEFARTAGESNLTSVTARGWSIVSGPAGSGSTIGTAAALSWTPTVAGDYVLRYSATHSAGTSTDDVAVTVTNPRPALVLDRGSAQNITAQTTTAVALTSPTTIATGNYLIARVAVDNSGTNGAAPGCTVTDPRSNTWTVLGPALVDPGAAAAGATAYIAYAKVATAYQAADSLTFNWGGVSTTAKAVVVEEWTYVHATTPVAVSAVTATGTASSALSISITPTAADQAVYTCLAVEGPTGDTAPTDADTTNGPWVALTRLATASGTAASNQTVSGAYKQVTASGSQTWDATITARDWAALAVVLAPPPTASTLTGDATLAATATIGAAGLVERPSGASLAATSTITSVGAVTRPAGASLATTATLTTAGEATRATGASLTLTATLTSASVVERVTGATLAGTATLTTAGLVDRQTGASLAGNATITTAGAADRPSIATLDATASLTTAGFVDRRSGAALATTTTISTAGLVERVTTASLATTAAISTAGVSLLTSGAALVGAATVLASSGASATATVNLAGTATITPSGSVLRPGVTSLAATAVLTAGAAVERIATAALAITNSIIAVGFTSRVTGAVLAGTASISGAGALTLPSAATLTLTATVTSAGAVGGVSLLAITATVTTAGAATRITTASLSVAASLTAAGSLTLPAAAALAGTATLSAGALRIAVLGATLAVTAGFAAVGDIPSSWGPPSGLLAVSVSPTQIDLSWDAMASASGYDIERDGVLIAADVVGTSYSDSGLAAGSTHIYRARSVRA